MSFDCRAALETGVDIPIAECQITAHQPSIKEISMLGEDVFFIGVQTLCLYKNMFIKDESVLDEVSNFQIFMMIMRDKETIDKRQAVMNVLQLVFPKYKTLVTPQSLLFSSEDGNNSIIDENNFDFLQNVLRLIFCSKTGPMDQQAFNPANAKAKEIAEKLMKGRQRVAEQKGSANISVFSQYISILSVGLQIPKTVLREYTMPMLYDEMERYTLYINWDLDIKTRLAGGKPDSSPENWMKNIH